MLKKFLDLEQVNVFPYLLLVLVFTATANAFQEKPLKNLIIKKTEPAILSQFSFEYFAGWVIENDDTSYEYRCGGVLIEPETLVVSAHCILQTDKMPIVVRPGILPANSTKRTEVPITKVVVHPKYSPSSTDYDIALLKLVGHASDNNLHMWMKPDFQPEKVKMYCYNGLKYGNSDFAYDEPIKEPVVSKKDCQKYDDNVGKFPKFALSEWKRSQKDGYLCTREPQKLTRKCLHSFGGPLLMYRLNDDYEVLLGIGCGNCPKGVFTYVQKHHGWIKSVLTSFEHHFVVGGVRAKPGEFPFMAALGWKSKTNPGTIEYKCGGVLIDARYVLTAAHCFYDSDEMPTVVRARGADLTDASVEDLEIESIIEHPDYKYPAAYNDIALVFLRGPATAIFVRIWRDEYIDFNETVTVIGYGDTKFAGAGSKELLKANLSLIPNDECKKHYDSSFFNVEDGIIDTQICAYDKMKMRDACQGDSGGPLLMTMKRGKYVEPLLLGITSFGVGCASGTPGVYTRISKYNEWIRETVCEWSNLDCLFRPNQSRKPVFDNIYFLGWTSKERYGPIDYKCAGVLVHYNVATFPAHCIFIFETPPDVLRSYGVNSTEVRIAKIIKFGAHPNYTHPSLYNDVALFSLEFVEDKPISFWPWYEMDVESVRDHGYLEPVFTGIAADVGLLNLEPLPDKECQAYYESLECITYHDPKFTQGVFCARDPENQNNRGIVGPLVMHANDIAYNFTGNFIMGLSTMTFNCGDHTMRFYTRIANHIPWMVQVLYATKAADS